MKIFQTVRVFESYRVDKQRDRQTDRHTHPQANATENTIHKQMQDITTVTYHTHVYVFLHIHSLYPRPISEVVLFSAECVRLEPLLFLYPRP